MATFMFINSLANAAFGGGPSLKEHQQAHRQWRETVLQNHFGPIVGIKDLTDEELRSLEQSADEYRTRHASL